MSFYFWWPFLIIGLFLIPEIVAWLDHKPGGTFSHWIWDLFALWKGTTQRYAHIRRLLFGAFWTALTGHLFLHTSAFWIFFFGVGCTWSAVYHYRNER